MASAAFPMATGLNVGAEPRPAVLRGAILLLLALALAWQGFVTGTHIHSPRHSLPALSAGAAQHGIAKLGNGERKDSDEPACPLCEAVAMAGAYYLAVDFAPLPPAVFVAPAAFFVPLASRPPPGGPGSHAWRSRAPPHSN